MELQKYNKILKENKFKDNQIKDNHKNKKIIKILFPKTLRKWILSGSNNPTRKKDQVKWIELKVIKVISNKLCRVQTM